MLGCYKSRWMRIRSALKLTMDPVGLGLSWQEVTRQANRSPPECRRDLSLAFWDALICNR